ncbi:uncharacterized protein LOC144108559 [Amblyomma americanum]
MSIKRFEHCFAVVFVTVEFHGKGRPRKDHPDYTGSPNDLFDPIITQAEVIAELQRLNTSSAPGPERVHKALRNLDSPCVKTLTDYFKECLLGGTLPPQWKDVKVVFIPKSGKPLLPANLCPISVKLCVGKLMERVLQTRLSRYLENLHNMASCYLGFRQDSKGKKTKPPVMTSVGPAEADRAMAAPEARRESYVPVDQYGGHPYYAPSNTRQFPPPLAAEKKQLYQEDFLDSKPLLLLRMFTILAVVVVSFFLAFVMVTESGFERRKDSAPSSSAAPATTKAHPPITAPTPVRRTTAHEPEVTEDVYYPPEDSRESKAQDGESKAARAEVLMWAPLNGWKSSKAAPGASHSHPSGQHTATPRRKTATHNRRSKQGWREAEGRAH